MLTNTDMSIIMQGYLTNAIDFLKKKGYILPSLVVLNKGKALDLEVSHKGILEVGTTADEEDLLDPDEDETYEYGIAFKLNDAYRDHYLSEVASSVAKDFQPDAIGAISACLLRELPDGEIPAELNIQKDAQTIKVIFISYFLKGEDKPHYMVVPYMKTEIEDPGWGEDAYSIHTVASSWNSGVDAEDLLMPNPYKGGSNE